MNFKNIKTDNIKEIQKELFLNHMVNVQPFFAENSQLYLIGSKNNVWALSTGINNVFNDVENGKFEKNEIDFDKLKSLKKKLKKM